MSLMYTNINFQVIVVFPEVDKLLSGHSVWLIWVGCRFLLSLVPLILHLSKLFCQSVLLEDSFAREAYLPQFVGLLNIGPLIVVVTLSSNRLRKRGSNRELSWSVIWWLSTDDITHRSNYISFYHLRTYDVRNCATHPRFRSYFTFLISRGLTILSLSSRRWRRTAESPLMMLKLPWRVSGLDRVKNSKSIKSRSSP